MLFITVFTCRLLLKVNMFPLKFTSEKSTLNINSHMINNTHHWMKAGKISGLAAFLMKIQNSCVFFFQLFHLWEMQFISICGKKERSCSIARVSLTHKAFFWYCYRLYCSKKAAGFSSVWADSQFTLFGVVWLGGRGSFSKYCDLKFINSQNLKMLKYWLAQPLIRWCSYRELEEPPMGFLLQQYCTYYMNKLHCCIMQLLHHQFRE